MVTVVIPKKYRLGSYYETANVHLGSPDAVQAVRHDLETRPAGWLRKAVETMKEATLRDWKEWKKSGAS